VSTIWYKVWRDLARNTARTLLAVLSTAVGVFTLGLVFGMSGVMRAQMMATHHASIPAHITLWGGPFDSDTVDAVRREPGLEDTEGEIVASFRWKPDGEAEWHNGRLVARDYVDQRINLLRLLEGQWPGRRALAVERQAASFFGIPVGTTIVVEFDQSERSLPVEGVVRAQVTIPPQWGGDSTFFATPETAAWLTGHPYEESFNRLSVRLESFSEAEALEAAAQIERRLERVGFFVEGREISDPNAHWLQEMVDGILIVLLGMGILSLGLSGFLIVNTMNAIIAQQVWQIGVMKAVGATLARVMRVYLATALFYGGAALLLAVPLGAVGAYLTSAWLLDTFNAGLSGFRVEPVAIGVQAVIGVAVPVLAAAIPVVGGVRITTREAISTRGLGTGFGRNWLDRMLGHVRHLPRLLVLSLRNTFRRKARVALTLATLTLGGAMFAMIMSVSKSWDNTVSTIFNQSGEDVSLVFEEPQRVSRLVEIAESVPEVAAIEVWGDQQAIVVLACDKERQVALNGVPSGSEMFNPRVYGGRGLQPGDGRVVLVDNRLAREEGVELGEVITMRIAGEESEWTVVGFSMGVSTLFDSCFVPFDAMGREAGTFGRGRNLKVRTEQDDFESQQRVIQALGDACAAQHIEVSSAWSTSQQWLEIRASFGVLIYLLMAMAVLTAVVGGIGLMSTMSINVVERAREIGVMRAIGGRSLAIAGVFVTEGVFVGVLSWLLAVPLSYPGARLFSAVLGDALMGFPMEFVYSVGGMALWLLIVVVLSTLASLWPAWQATKVSIRESLAYE
jgi:putative ABC transport system permease protein